MSAETEIRRLLSIVASLRSQQGCPWDRKQTSDTLKPYLLEETYEVLDAIGSKDPSMLCDELGDLLLQILLHSQIAEEVDHFTFEEVIKKISEKMVRRHPHVFGGKKVETVEEVWNNWERIKKTEKNVDTEETVFSGIPKIMPTLIRAEEVQRKASRVGFDWGSPEEAFSKLLEEVSETEEVMNDKDRTHQRLEEEIGDVLFSVVNVARKYNISAENALRVATIKFEDRFNYVSAKAASADKQVNNMSINELEKIWNEAKSRNKDKQVEK